MFDWQNWSLFFSQFHFIRPLWLLALIPAYILIAIRWKSDTKEEWHTTLPPHLRQALTIKQTGWQRQLPLKVLSATITLAIITCAGPTWQREVSPFGEDKAEVVFLLDVSHSMMQTDVPPSRLERAKHKIMDMIEYRSGGRNALIAFAGSAHVAMPMTYDQGVFAPFLTAIEPRIMPVAGKRVEQSLPALNTLLPDDTGATIVLVSDGVSASSIEMFAEYFQQTSHSLVVLAIGQPSSTSSNPTGYADLSRLASEAGGNLVHLSVDNKDIEQVTRLVERNMQLNGDNKMPWKDMGYTLLIPIALLWLLWFRKGWLVQWAVLIALGLPSYLVSPSAYAQTTDVASIEATKVATPTQWQQWWWDLWMTRDQQGQRLMNRGHYLQAAHQFESPIYQGVAYYYGRDYQQAHHAFMAAQSDLGDLYASMALARQREYLASRNLLQQLSDKPNLDSNLRHKVEQNLSAVKAIIEEIERYSESQMNTTDGAEESFEIGDNPQTSEGAEETVTEELLMKESLNANEILGSEALAQRWLDRIESDPSLFLQNKFYLQLEQQPTAGEPQ
ncbi:vWA domain-containing protein [Vibrio astriarenae]